VKRPVSLALFAAMLGLGPALAHAHKPSDTVLDLRGVRDGVLGHWEIALSDLDHAVDLDADDALAHLGLSAAGAPCPAHASLAGIARRTDGVYAVLALDAHCPAAAALAVRYDLFFDFDAQHRGLLRWDGPTGASRGLFRKDARTIQLQLSRPVGLGAELRAKRPAALVPAAGLLIALALLPWVLLRRRATA
jgi:hypothetical protein